MYRLLAAVTALALPSIAAAQTWQVTDVYSSGPLRAGGLSTSLTLSARLLEDEDAGALQALVQLHAAVGLGSLELRGGGYNSFRNA